MKLKFDRCGRCGYVNQVKGEEFLYYIVCLCDIHNPEPLPAEVEINDKN